MFYYPYVLQRHSGCFSTIWLAATKGIRLQRREFLKVNVGRTCEDIMDYVLVQAPPRHPSLPRPRFSLYLSSQLQYGVIIVYHRQCVILLEEIQQTIERLLRAGRHAWIDVAELDRRAHTLQDTLVLLEEAERAQDPFFGVMGADQGLPSPYRFLQPWQHMEAVSPQSPLVRAHYTTQEGRTASSGSITLKEKEMPVIPATEFEGAELPEVTVNEIDMLMEQQDQFCEELEDKEREREAEGDRLTLSGTMISVEPLKDPTVEETVWLLDEETGHPVEVPVLGAQAERTPTSIVIPVALPTQPNEKSEGEGSSGSVVLLVGPSHHRLSPAELFNTPCSSIFHPDIMALWTRSISLPPSAERRKAEEGAFMPESEGNMEVVRKESMKHKDSSIREVSSELIESALASEASAVSEILLEVPKDDQPQDQITPIRRWSPVEGAPVPMEGIPEEHVELPPRVMGELVVTTESMQELICHYLMQNGKVYFKSLLPPETNRSTAAQVFCIVLELVSARKIGVSQAKPYGSITIAPGQQFAIA